MWFWWWRYIFDHPMHAVVGLVLGAVICLLVFYKRTGTGGSRDGPQDEDDEAHDGDDGLQEPSDGSQELGDVSSSGDTAASPDGGNVVTPPAGVPSADFDSEAATLVGDANRWFQSGRPALAITVKGCAKLKVEGKGSGAIGEVSIGFDGEQEFDAPAGAELKFVGLVRIAFTGDGTVTIGENGVARLQQGGSLNIKDSAEVTLTEGALLEAANLPSVSASYTIADGLCIMATGCENVFGREGLRLLTARCGTVYASDGDVFAYKCRKVHASKDAVVYAVMCDDVSATDRSRVCHLKCGKVRQSDKAVLEKHDVDR